MKGTLTFIFLAFLAITKVSGQMSIASYGGSGAKITTYSEVIAGSTSANYSTIQINPKGVSYPAGWKLKVRANGNFTNGSSSILSKYVSLKLNNGPDGVSGGATALTLTDADLTTSTKLIDGWYSAFSFDMIIQGGPHLMVPVTGVYSTSFTLSFYDLNNQLVASNSIPISIIINYNNTCSATAFGDINSTPYNFDSYNKLLGIATLSEAITIPYSSDNTNCRGWTLKVRATGNFVNGSSSLSPDYVSLRFNRVSDGPAANTDIGASTNPIALSMSDVILINQSDAPFGYSSAHKFDMIIQGGNALSSLITQGTYTCPLIFTLYNQNGQQVSIKNASISFQITYAKSTSFTLTLQSPNVLLQYSTPANYINGVSVDKPNGLRIVGFEAYQVIVKTIGPNLTNGDYTLPVSTIRLQNAASTAKSGIVSTNVSLSAVDQVIITNNMADHTYQTVDYNLKYLMAPNGTVTTAPSGIYTTHVIYLVLPK